MKQSKFIVSTAAMALVSLSACAATSTDTDTSEEAWTPSQDVVLNVPFGPGGGTDTLARAMAEGLQDVRPDLRIGVENRPGAGGATGFTWVHGRNGDPHVLTTIEGSILMLPQFTDLPFAWDDFTMIGTAAEYFGAVVAEPGRFEDLPDLINAAQTESLTIGTTGPQDLWAMAGAALGAESGVTFQPVAFDSAGAAVGAVVAGDVDLAIVAPEISVEFIKSGDLDALAVLSDDRLESEEFSSVPTATEQGVGVSFTLPKGLAAPGDISESEREYWTAVFEEWTETDSYDEFVSQNFLIPRATTGPETEDAMREAEEVVSELVEVSGAGA